MATKLMRTRCFSNLFDKSPAAAFLGHKTRLTNFAKCKNSAAENERVNKFSCKFSVSSKVRGTAGHAETTSTTQGLSKLQAQELILRLNGEERSILMSALQEYQSKLIKDEYEGQLAASRWRSKYGRPSKLPRLGDVDPTGTFCAFPEDWLKKKMGTVFFIPAFGERSRGLALDLKTNIDLVHLLMTGSGLYGVVFETEFW